MRTGLQGLQTRKEGLTLAGFCGLAPRSIYGRGRTRDFSLNRATCGPTLAPATEAGAVSRGGGEPQTRPVVQRRCVDCVLTSQSACQLATYTQSNSHAQLTERVHLGDMD